VAALHRYGALLALSLSLALASTGWSAVAQAEGPEKVVVGVYVNQVYGLDLKGNQFSADFYLWFRWQNDEIKPLESFELANGRITSKTGVVKKKLPDGTNYASCRVVATITRFWDITRYPLDDQSLTFDIEDNEHEVNELVYVPDAQNSGVNAGVTVPGWHVGKLQQMVTRQTYHTNYGDTSLSPNGSSYSRFSLAVPLVRAGRARLLKAFFGLFVAVLVSFLAFFVRPKDTGPRVSLAVGALFAAAASSLALHAQLPESEALTMTERMMIVTFTMIFFSAGITTISLNLLYLGKDKILTRIDRIGGVVSPFLFLWLFYSYVL
jgi:hypothetical protein